MDVIDAILGAFSAIFGWLRDALHRAFALVSQWVTDFARWVTGWVQGFVDQLWGTLNAVWVAVTAISDWVEQTGKHLLEAATSIASDWGHWALGWAQRMRNDLFDWASQLFGELRHLIDGTMSWINNTVNPFMASIFDTVTGWVERNVSAVLRAAIGVVDDFAHGVWGWVSDRVGGLLSWVDRTGGYLYNLVHGAEDWLAFVAKHSLSWFLDLWQWLTHVGGREVMAGLTDAAASEGGPVEDWIAKWLGSLFVLVALVVAFAPRKLGRRR